MNCQKIEGVLGFLKRERNNRGGKRWSRVGELFLDPRDVGLEHTPRTVDEVADLWQRGDW